ncbi:hypothetical protein C6Y02_17050 [Bacillus sp. NMCC4]|uniref:hypothetical protein n=1 Tax=Bacillus sp. NMCC4 TaxID=2108539 RepID=UPI000D02E716|nr:hypothetical protein [Bacillus sp. NMCC4]PRS35719.1 hypothetical protein C6Y02_17050 [Bacillus sp. NMCC4]
MSISPKDKKLTRELAMRILQVKGEDHSIWLHEQYKSVVEENQEVILQGLSSLSSNTDKGKEEF